MSRAQKPMDTFDLAGDTWLERTRNDGGEYPDCPDCGGRWNPMWPPILQRRHPADCRFVAEMNPETGS